MFGRDFIHQAMFARNAPRPVARQIPLQRFRLADAVERVPAYRGNERVYLVKSLCIRSRPLPVFLKGGFAETYHAVLPTGLGDCVFEGVKGEKVSSCFNIVNRLQEPFTVSSRRKEVCGFILFTGHGLRRGMRRLVNLHGYPGLPQGNPGGYIKVHPAAGGGFL